MRSDIDLALFLFGVFQLREELSDLGEVFSNERLTALTLYQYFRVTPLYYVENTDLFCWLALSGIAAATFKVGPAESLFVAEVCEVLSFQTNYVPRY